VTSRSRVFLTDPGFHAESRQVAAALSESGWRYRLHTSVFVTPGSRRLRLAERLPRVGKSLVHLALRRHDPGLDPGSVTSWFFPDVLRRLLRRLGAGDALVTTAVNVSFDRFAALLVPRGTDVVVVMHGAALATVRAARRRGARTVIFVNSPDALTVAKSLSEEAERLGLSVKDVSRTFHWLGERIRRELVEADLVVANSGFTGRDLVAHGVVAEKIRVVPLGVEAALFSPGPRTARDDGAATILCVASVGLRKGVVHLARAVDLLRGRGIACGARVYGAVDPSYRPALVPYLETGALELCGFVSHTDLRDVYARGDVFVLPTLSDGFGLVVYEAMACGLPVVVTDCCGADVIDGHNGLVVPAGDDEALAAAVERLLVDPAYAAQIAAAGVETARAASWSRYRRTVVSEIEALAAGQAQRARAKVPE